MFLQGDKVSPLTAFMAKEGTFILVNVKVTFLIAAKGAGFQDRLS